MAARNHDLTPLQHWPKVGTFRQYQRVNEGIFKDWLDDRAHRRARLPKVIVESILDAVIVDPSFRKGFEFDSDLSKHDQKSASEGRMDILSGFSQQASLSLRIFKHAAAADRTDQATHRARPVDGAPLKSRVLHKRASPYLHALPLSARALISNWGASWCRAPRGACACRRR